MQYRLSPLVVSGEAEAAAPACDAGTEAAGLLEDFLLPDGATDKPFAMVTA